MPVASTEIFCFLLFWGFGVVEVVLAVPEDTEEKIEVEMDPGETPMAILRFCPTTSWAESL
jgi:hypothetical protein